MARELALEPLLPIADIQGDILVGLLKRHQHFMFFKITDVARFKVFVRSLHLTSMAECLGQRATIATLKEAGSDKVLPTPGLNIAFTSSGLQLLGVPAYPPATGIEAFRAGMHARRDILADPKASNWKILSPSNNLHGVFIVTGASHAEVVDIISLRLAPPAANGWSLRHEEVGEVRPDPVRGHEHFGYADGVSQPGVRGRIAAAEPLTPQAPGAEESQGQKGQDLLWPGEFLFGYPGQDAAAASFAVQGPVSTPPVPFMQDGAFMVFRRLAQAVPEFNASVKAAARSLPATAEPTDPDLLGAQLVGRWKSGAAIINAPTADNPAIGDDTPEVNAFEFGDDRQGLVCPLATHIRKAYPRDDVPGDTAASDEAVIAAAEAETQSHRMMRRGISFGPEVSEKEALEQESAGGDKTRGLLFACYVTSIEDQFEFVQQSWCNDPDFSQPGSGIDPIIGQSASATQPFVGAAPVSRDPAKRPALQLGRFVHLEGGAYFFAPAIPALKAL